MSIPLTYAIAFSLFVVALTAIIMALVLALRDLNRTAIYIMTLLMRLVSSRPCPSPTAMQLSQFQGVTPMPITGIIAGQSGTFGETPLPAGSAFPSGTTFTWTTDDAAETALAPSADGTKVAVAVAATAAKTTFNLTCTSSFTPPGGSVPVGVTVAVPILPPAAATPTGMQIDQLA